MFTSLSWKGFVLSVMVLLAIYYPIIIALFFRSDLKKGFLFLRKGNRNSVFERPLAEPFSKTSSSRQTHLFGDEEEYRPESLVPGIDLEQLLQEEVREMMEMLTQVIMEAGKMKSPKEELMYGLQLLLKKYPTVKTSEMVQPVNQYIIRAAEQYCSIHLNAEEAGRLWRG